MLYRIYRDVDSRVILPERSVSTLNTFLGTTGHINKVCHQVLMGEILC